MAARGAMRPMRTAMTRDPMAPALRGRAATRLDTDMARRDARWPCGRRQGSTGAQVREEAVGIWREGRSPDCQSRTSCSRRPKMRVRHAMIRACSAAGTQAHFGCAKAAVCSWANWAANPGD